MLENPECSKYSPRGRSKVVAPFCNRAKQFYPILIHVVTQTVNCEARRTLSTLLSLDRCLIWSLFNNHTNPFMTQLKVDFDNRSPVKRTNWAIPHHL